MVEEGDKVDLEPIGLEGCNNPDYVVIDVYETYFIAECRTCGIMMAQPKTGYE